MLYVCFLMCLFAFFFFKQKTAYEMRISDWSSDVCSSDLPRRSPRRDGGLARPVVEAAARLFADPARLDILDEQRGGAEFGVAGAAVEDADDFEAGVEADEIGQRDRSHRMVEAEAARSEEHTSELQSLMRISYAVFCLKKKTNNK